MTVGCLEESTVLAFLGGRLPRDARFLVESHVATCSACADLVTWTAADQASVTRWPGHEGRPFVGELHPGARIGRYQILGALGRGGMGEVYAAYHPDLDRRIAVKVVQGSGGSADERRGRLLREARAIARLSHPNVITVHDAGTFGDRVFIAMELVDGWTIEQWLRAESRSWQQILDVFVAAGRGLAAAHAAGVVHRDFKPQNVMIAKEGAVRVTDFGLARFAAEDDGDRRPANEDEPPQPIGNLTKTGALVGTPAYMSPEQFRREAPDARSDQFSFCVALHEALFGSRPTTAAAEGNPPTSLAFGSARQPDVPAWLRAIILRGAAGDRERRYLSMNVLLAAIEHGRTRPRRRAVATALVMVTFLLSVGAWRVAHGNRFTCAVPEARLAAAWASGPGDARRQSIHRIFSLSGRATAETSWQRVSKVLDEYTTAWRSMYLQTCEATHIRGEQSAEVLDLRMSCLSDSLEQVRALSDVLLSSNANALSNAVAAARDLTPVSRCADVSLLRSAVRLPREESKLREVQRLRRALADMQTLLDFGDFAAVLKRATALRAEVESTGYKPLLGELLYYIGMTESEHDPDASRGDATLRQAMLVAEAARDDLTAARICTSLVFVSGYRLGRIDEAEFWAGLAHAILDRSGGDDPRMRSWIDTNWGGALARAGDFERARIVIARGAASKERALGKEHPDYAISLSELAYVLARGGHASESLDAGNRAVAIFEAHGDPDGFMLGVAYANQGEALYALGRRSEAEEAFERSLQNLTKNVGRMHPETAFALQGLGEVRLAQKSPIEAIVFFDDALRIRQQPHADPVLTAESEFGLARALWDGRRDRTRARRLATAASAIYAAERRELKQVMVQSWLAEHQR